MHVVGIVIYAAGITVFSKIEAAFMLFFGCTFSIYPLAWTLQYISRYLFFVPVLSWFLCMLHGLQKLIQHESWRRLIYQLLFDLWRGNDLFLWQWKEITPKIGDVNPSYATWGYLIDVLQIWRKKSNLPKCWCVFQISTLQVAEYFFHLTAIFVNQITLKSDKDIMLVAELISKPI